MTAATELRAALAKATPGPWFAFDNRKLNDAWWIGREKFVTHAECRQGSDDEPDRAAEDAALIVLMRNALPTLLDAHDAAQAHLAALEGAWRTMASADEGYHDSGWECFSDGYAAARIEIAEIARALLAQPIAEDQP